MKLEDFHRSTKKKKRRRVWSIPLPPPPLILHTPHSSVLRLLCG